MFEDGPVMTKGIVAFLIPTFLGPLSYLGATFFARCVSSVPRWVYIGRIAFLAVFVLLIWIFCLPFMGEAFSGSPERKAQYVLQYEYGAKSLGMFYGMHTLWIWLVLALLKWPKRFRKEDAT
jgi:hypothetical protein